MSELCANCGNYFANPAALLTHRRKSHREEGPEASMAQNPASRTPGVSCGLCGRTFPTPEHLAAHVLRPHPRRPSWGIPTRS